jgi:hypothetical protein
MRTREDVGERKFDTYFSLNLNLTLIVQPPLLPFDNQTTNIIIYVTAFTKVELQLTQTPQLGGFHFETRLISLRSNINLLYQSK